MSLQKTSRWFANLLAMALIVPTATVSDAGKPDKPRGGGGGGDDGGGDFQPAAYTITAFLPPDSTAISSAVQRTNEIGDAVGYVEYADGGRVAVHLDLVSNTYSTIANELTPTDINNARQIVGSKAFVDGFRGVFLDSPSDGLGTVLPPLPGDDDSGAVRINDHGIVTGWSRGDAEEIGVVWFVSSDAEGALVVDGPVALSDPSQSAYTSANDINEVVVGSDGTATAQVVGTSGLGVVVWTVTVDSAGLLTEPTVDRVVDGVDPPFSAGWGINNFGDASGRSGSDPFVSFSDQTTLILPVPRRTLTSNAFDINDALEVVGYVETGRLRPGTRDATLWSNGNRISLATQIASDSGWDELSVAVSINQFGVIGGVGERNGASLGFILIPLNP